MKLLQINAVYGHGSTGVITEQIGQEAQANGFESYGASPDLKDGERTFSIGSVFGHKLHALLCRIHGKQAYFSSHATRKLLRYMDHLQPDVVHLHNLHSNYIHYNMLMDYLAKKNIPTVITMHDCWFYTGKCFHYTMAGCDRWKTGCGQCPKPKGDTPSFFGDHTAEVCADRIERLKAIPRLWLVGVSDWMANEARASLAGNVPITRIYNSIDTKIFSPSPSSLRQKLNLENKFVILGLAGKWLQPINEDALNAFSRLSDNNTSFLLIGCEPKKQTKLPDGIMALGYIHDPHELAEIYSMADVFVNVTREDSLSLVNVECQACGTPVITYAACGATETVAADFAVAPGNVEGLLQKVDRIRKEGKKVYSSACRNWIVENFSGTYSHYMDLYSDLLE